MGCDRDITTELSAVRRHGFLDQLSLAWNQPRRGKADRETVR